MPIGDKHYVHDSLVQTLRLRDTLDVCGEKAAAASAQVLADALWALTRPTKVTKPATLVKSEEWLHDAPKVDTPSAAAEDTDNPFEGL